MKLFKKAKEKSAQSTSKPDSKVVKNSDSKEYAYNSRPFLKSLLTLRFSDISLSNRMYLSFGVILLIFLIAIISSLNIINKSTNESSLFLDKVDKAYQDVSRLRSEIGKFELITGDYLISKSPENIEKILGMDIKNIEKVPDRLKKIIDGLDRDSLKLLKGSLTSVHLPKIKEYLDNYVLSIGQIQGKLKQNQDVSRDIGNATAKFIFPLIHEFNNVEKNLLHYVILDTKNNADVVSRTKYELIGSFVIASIAAILIVFLLNRSFNTEIRRLWQSLVQLAKGNMQRKNVIKHFNEIGNIENMVDKVADTMNTTVFKLRNDFKTMHSMMDQSTVQIEDIQSGSEIQSSKANDVAEATTVLESSIQKVTEFAKQTLDEVKSAEEASDTCRVTMQDNITTTHALADRLRDTSVSIMHVNDMGDQIREIVKTIADIADQTNLLALNATIEAARSGTYGRGFAVVADEIRELAFRTAKSTKEVAATIEKLSGAVDNSVKVMASCEDEMEKSVRQSSRANSSIEEIMGIIATISDMSEEIVNSCQEQQARTSDVNQSIVNINTLQQNNINTIQSIKQSVDDISKLASTQYSDLQFFKLKE